MVELASLIAREEFSDRPRCVCPVIGAFLRAWNDRAGYADRQRLRPYAARIVGSRAGSQVTRERRDICLEWIGADLRGGPLRRALERFRMRTRIALYCGLGEALRLKRGAGGYAARVLFSRRDAEEALLLLDAMLALGTVYMPRPSADPVPADRGGGVGRKMGAPSPKMRLTFRRRSRYLHAGHARDDAGSLRKAHNVEVWTRP